MYKIAMTVIAAALASAAPAFADDAHHPANAAAAKGALPKAAPPAAAALTEGTVKKVDQAAGKVTLAHGPLNGMPGMTMVFRVKEAAWIGKMKEGQKIRFAAADINGAMTVVRFEPLE